MYDTRLVSQCTLLVLMLEEFLYVRITFNRVCIGLPSVPSGMTWPWSLQMPSLVQRKSLRLLTWRHAQLALEVALEQAPVERPVLHVVAWVK